MTTEEKELLQRIADLCYQASEEIYEDEALEKSEILSMCDELYEAIDNYLGN